MAHIPASHESEVPFKRTTSLIWKKYLFCGLLYKLSFTEIWQMFSQGSVVAEERSSWAFEYLTKDVRPPLIGYGRQYFLGQIIQSGASPHPVSGCARLLCDVRGKAVGSRVSLLTSWSSFRAPRLCGPTMLP
jgi:hypothetical protein